MGGLRMIKCETLLAEQRNDAVCCFEKKNWKQQPKDSGCMTIYFDERDILGAIRGKGELMSDVLRWSF